MMRLVEQKLLTLLGHWSSPTLYSVVYIAQYLIFCVVLSGVIVCTFCPFAFGYCIYCLSCFDITFSNYPFGI